MAGQSRHGEAAQIPQREEGRTEGALQKTVEIVASMFDNGFSVDVIARVTGLTIEEVKAIERKIFNR